MSDGNTPADLYDHAQANLEALQEQLKALVILDGTSLDWPGVKRACEAVKNTVDVLWKNLEESRVCQDALEEDVHCLEKSQKGAKERIGELEDENRQHEKTAAKLRNDVNSARQRAATALENENSLREQVEEARRAHEEVITAFQKAESDMEFMDAEITGLKEKVGSQDIEIASLREKAAHAEILSSELDEKSCSLEDVTREVTITKSKITTLEAELDAALIQRDTLQKDLRASKRDCEALTKDVTETREGICRLKELHGVVKKLGDERAKEDVAKFRLEREELQDRIKGALREIESLRAEKQSFIDKDKVRESEARALAQTISFMEKQIRDLQSQQTTMEYQKTADQKHRESREAEIHDLRTEKEALVGEVERLKSKLTSVGSSFKDALSKETAVLRSQIEDGSKEAAVQKAIAEGWMREAKSLDTQLKGCKQANKHLEQQVSNFQDDIRQHGFREIQNRASKDQRVQDLNAALERREAELRKVKEEADFHQRHLQRMVDRLKKENYTIYDDMERLCKIKLPPLMMASKLQPEIDQSSQRTLRRFRTAMSWNGEAPPSIERLAPLSRHDHAAPERGSP
ncbi:hypothetical protein BSKO_10873 [Bryopsis sp. KO-2023]|nr:hypothetical protein BSKO_10873 [Bryopsis sp. KO-2023]